MFSHLYSSKPQHLAPLQPSSAFQSEKLTTSSYLLKSAAQFADDGHDVEAIELYQSALASVIQASSDEHGQVGQVTARQLARALVNVREHNSKQALSLPPAPVQEPPPTQLQPAAVALMLWHMYVRWVWWIVTAPALFTWRTMLWAIVAAYSFLVSMGVVEALCQTLEHAEDRFRISQRIGETLAVAFVVVVKVVETILT
jgi:hypothetical protein